MVTGWLGVALAEAGAEERVPDRAAKYRLGPRAQLRYQDLVVTRGGSRWRGKVLDRGAVIRIRLEDQSELAIPREDVDSITRVLHPGLLHDGQFGARISPGIEVAFASTDANPGLQHGLLVETAFAYNFGGALEPELVIAHTPLGPSPDDANLQVALGVRYYLQPTKASKPFTHTQIVVYGSHQDLGLRTGPGFLWDLGPNVGIGISQGVVIMTQLDPESVAIGYHAVATGQGRF
jgi:hypothetical protein